MKTMEIKNKQFGLYINGQIQEGHDHFDAIDPSSEEVVAKITNASKEHMFNAISAARKAFDQGPWKDFTCAQRGIYLKKIAKLIRDNAKELAKLETQDVGKTNKQSTFIDIPTAAETFDYFSDVHEQLEAHDNKVDGPVDSKTEYEPIGVIGQIIPWNYPLIMFAWKVAPALITGNTIVFKPSPLASASIMRLAELIKDNVDLPEGVLNIVSSNDIEASKAIVESADVDMVSFTGGTTTGQEIMKVAALTTKKVSLELGGKSPNIVFTDANQEAALGGTLSAIFMNQGAMCTAGSRLLLEESIYDEFLEKLVNKAESLVIGDPQDASTQFGPIISQEHRDKILKMIEEAVSDGAKIVCGGKIPEDKEKGFYIEPTILVDIDNSMKIAQEEVFGPVLSVIKFKGEEEALRLANDSKFGLAACIWTQDENKAKSIAKKLQCGTVWINTYGGFYNEAPFGGCKQSGFGRELGLEGIKEYVQAKHICIDKTPGGMPLAASWF